MKKIFKIMIVFLFILNIENVNALNENITTETISRETFMDSAVKLDDTLDDSGFKVEIKGGSGYKIWDIDLKNATESCTYSNYNSYTTLPYSHFLNKNASKVVAITFDKTVMDDVELDIFYSNVGYIGDKVVNMLVKITNIVYDSQSSNGYKFPAMQIISKPEYGISVTYWKSADYEVLYYDAKTNEQINVSRSLFTFSSLNHGEGAKDEAVGLLSEAETVVFTDNTNLTLSKNESRFDNLVTIVPTSNDFIDELGSSNFEKNSTTVIFEDEIKFRLFSKGRNTFWFTIYPLALTAQTPDEPLKTVDKTKVRLNDEIEYQISQKVNKLGVNALVRYNSFEITDELSSALEITDAYLTDENNKEIEISNNANIITNGQLTIDKQKVSYKFSDDFLTYMPLNGETYVLHIKAKVINEDVDVINNIATSNINNIDLSTNSTKLKIIKKYKIDTEVINGIIDNSTTVETDDNIKISYGPYNGYILKRITVDNKEIDIKDYENNYIFTNVSSDHKITVEYEFENPQTGSNSLIIFSCITVITFTAVIILSKKKIFNIGIKG